MKKQYSLFIGRWQPFHVGHKALIDVVLNEGKFVVIGIRDTNIDKDNPYTVAERRKMIRKVYKDKDRVRIVTLPDIVEVVHGRKVGWGIREIKLPEDIESISATKIRNENIN